jgi:putative heme transporter
VTRLADEHGVTARAANSSVVRVAAVTVLVGALTLAIWVQRNTIGGALGEIAGLSALAITGLAALTVYERWSRANIVRRLLGTDVAIGRAVTIHDVGTAVSKGVPLGGALGTALRWSISRESDVRPARFASMLIAYGIATSFVSWLLPLAALSIDLTQRSIHFADVVIASVIVAVLAGSAVFWTLILRSDRLELWASTRMRGLFGRLARRLPSVGAHDPATGVSEVRTELRAIARRPWWLLSRTLLAQATGAIILFVSLRSLGVGSELGATEFFRVFFLAHLAGTFAPTPGGVGVVEAGTTGALMAAGVDTTTALAGVLIYRFLTYVLPIAFGAALYVAWRMGRTRRVRSTEVRPARLAVHGPSFDTSLPDLSRLAHQGVRDDRHVGRHHDTP